MKKKFRELFDALSERDYSEADLNKLRDDFLELVSELREEMLYRLEQHINS